MAGALGRQPSSALHEPYAMRRVAATGATQIRSNSASRLAPASAGSSSRIVASAGAHGGLSRPAFPSTVAAVESAYGVRSRELPGSAPRSTLLPSGSPHLGRSRSNESSAQRSSSTSASRPSSGAHVQASRRAASPAASLLRPPTDYSLPEQPRALPRKSSISGGSRPAASLTPYSPITPMRPAATTSTTAAGKTTSVARPLGLNGMAGMRGGGPAQGPVRAFAQVSPAPSAQTPASTSSQAAAALTLLKRARSGSSSESTGASTAPPPSFVRRPSIERTAYAAPPHAASSVAASPVPAASASSSSPSSSLLGLNAVRRASVTNGSVTSTLADERAALRRRLDEQREPLHTPQRSQPTQPQQHLNSPSQQSHEVRPRRASGHPSPGSSPAAAAGNPYSSAFERAPSPSLHAIPGMTQHAPYPSHTSQQQLQAAGAAAHSFVPSPQMPHRASLSSLPASALTSALASPAPSPYSASPLLVPRTIIASPAHQLHTAVTSAHSSHHSSNTSSPGGLNVPAAAAATTNGAYVAANRVANITHHFAPSTAPATTPDSSRHSEASSSPTAPAGLQSVRSAYHASHGVMTSLPSQSRSATGISQHGHVDSHGHMVGPEASASPRSSCSALSHHQEWADEEQELRDADYAEAEEEHSRFERRLVANSRRTSYDPQHREQRLRSGSGADATPPAPTLRREPSVSFSFAVPPGAAHPSSSSSSSSSSASHPPGHRAPPLRALVGLSNLGNTCFLNSTLQCLMSTPGFLHYFAGGAFEKDINPRGARTRGQLAQSFGDLARRMVRAPDHSVERPSAVKAAIGIIDSKFSGYGQHDSHEFGRVLLSALHDELNRVVVKPPYEEIKDGEGDSVATKADRWWRNHTERNQSIVMECFAGQLQSSLACRSCNRKSEAFDPFLDLSLPLPKANSRAAGGGGLASAVQRLSLGSSSGSSAAVSRCTLYQCFDEFLREEVLSGHEQVYCRACKTHRDHTKKLHVYRWPRMLVVHLKRFSFGAHQRAKINTDVDFGNELDLTKLTGAAHKQQAPPKYSLYGVSSHMGTASGGHYIAHCKVSDSDTAPFYTFNDSVVHAENSSAFKGPSAYLLFYRRKD